MQIPRPLKEDTRLDVDRLETRVEGGLRADFPKDLMENRKKNNERLRAEWKADIYEAMSFMEARRRNGLITRLFEIVTPVGVRYTNATGHETIELPPRQPTGYLYEKFALHVELY